MRHGASPATVADGTFDLLIEGGTVVDGTGSAGFRAAVGVRGDARGGAPGRRRRGSTPAAGSTPPATWSRPGFIDVHSHSGLMILAEPRHEPKVRQGVTTEVIGVDGNSYAPFRSRDDLLAFARLNAGLDGLPDHRLRLGLGRQSYLAPLRPAASASTWRSWWATRRCASTPLGWDDVPADATALDRMRGLLRESMEEGAFGLSSGLDYPPGAFASTAELAALTAEAARCGGIYHTHVRYALGDGFLDPFREAIEIGRQGGGPVHITHFYRRATAPGPAEQMIGLVEDARADGLDVTWDTYPYEWASTRLLIMLPPWVQAGGPGPLLERLADPAIRDRLRGELAERGTCLRGPRRPGTTCDWARCAPTPGASGRDAPWAS